jgi:hypothetical protein
LLVPRRDPSPIYGSAMEGILFRGEQCFKKSIPRAPMPVGGCDTRSVLLFLEEDVDRPLKSDAASFEPLPLENSRGATAARDP